MRIYFMDKNNRYIGNRELLIGESIPKYATKEPTTVSDGEEAYFVDGEWQVNKIIVDLQEQIIT